MNWKGEAIEKLRKYDAMRMSLQNIPMEMKRLEADAQSIRGARTDSTPVKGGGSAREDALLNNLAHRQELSWALEQAKYWVDITRRGLETLTPEEKLVLQRFYLTPEQGSVQRLCMELGVEQSSIYRKRDKALRKFALALYGQDLVGFVRSDNTMTLFGKKVYVLGADSKKHIAFLLGCLWHYIKKLQAKEFSDGCDIMAEIAILLGINWGLIQEACRKYEEVIEFEEEGHLMDIEKLIAGLSKEVYGSDVVELLLEAATALSTLQAENEKLRAELENYRKGHCSEGGCAAEKDRDAVLAELEQVKRERDAAIERVKRALAMMWFVYVNSDKEFPHNYETEALEEAERILGPWAECMPKYLRRD